MAGLSLRIPLVAARCIAPLRYSKLYTGGDVRCPRCGNENPVSNRFCGMCGATLLSPVPGPPQPAHQPPRSTPPPPSPPVAEPIRQAVPDAPRTATPVADEAPSIAGPSFLGLNDPAPERKRA